MKLLAFVLVLVASVASARADGDPVVLLPLDADKKLELYGQPIASELASALQKAGVGVVLVAPGMAVPKSRLILDGTVTDKAGAITIALRLRDPTGTTVDTFTATAPGVTALDKAAADLIAKVVPSVTTHLAAKPPDEHKAPPPPPPQQPAPKVMLVGTHATVAPGEPLRAAFAIELAAWAAQHHRTSKPADVGAKLPVLVGNASAELGATCEVGGYDMTTGEVPMARARVRVQVADGRRCCSIASS